MFELECIWVSQFEHPIESNRFYLADFLRLSSADSRWPNKAGDSESLNIYTHIQAEQRAWVLSNFVLFLNL